MIVIHTYIVERMNDVGKCTEDFHMSAWGSIAVVVAHRHIQELPFR